jgi:hypothetical protein
MTRDELVALAKFLDAPVGTEQEIQDVVNRLIDALPHGNILKLLYHTRPELTAEEAVDEALRRESEWRSSNAS